MRTSGAVVLKAGSRAYIVPASILKTEAKQLASVLRRFFCESLLTN